MSAARYIIAILAGVTALLMICLIIPHDPYVRWQSLNGTIFHRAEFHYERLHFDPTPVDVVFIGSSRTASGVVPEELERQLAERGSPLRVVDLSLPASGMDIRVTQVREALAAHPEIRLLVFAVVEALPRDGHQAFGDLGSTAEVLTSPVLVNRNLPASVLRLPMREVKLGAASALPEAFGFKTRFDPQSYLGTLYDYGAGTSHPADYDYRSAEHEAALRLESRRRKREITPPLLPERFADVEFGVSRESIETVLRLAADNGTDVVFLFLPFYEGYEEPRDAAWIRARGPLWIADWMRTEPSYYADAAHSSPVVRERLNGWFAEQITAHLAATRTAAVQQQDAL